MADVRIPTNLRTLKILEVLSETDDAMTATEINAHLGLPKQTVHRLCNTLEQEGYLVRYGNSQKFQASRKLRTISLGLLNHSRLHIARRQILLDVADKVGETVNFAVPGDAGMNYLDRVETDWAFRIQLPIGSSVPFHCTASGKCFLASLPARARRSRLGAMRLDSHTSNTITDTDAFEAQLKTIRKQGYAIDDEEFMEGMIAIAVPVLDEKGQFVAGLAFHGPTQRISIEDAEQHLPSLKTAAQRLNAVLFAPEDLRD
ncbi:MAG: IclR family transcriptional regulator [Pseudomonadota bacterium]